MPLISTNELPPGGWIYVQADAQGKFVKGFKQMGGFEAFCNSILIVRTANGLPRASLAEIAVDVEDQTCKRLGNDPRYCQTGSGPVAVKAGAFLATTGRACGHCGGRRA